MLGIMLVIWAFVLLTLAAARGARFVVIDKLTANVRAAIIRKYGQGYWLTTLTNCVACSSIWTSLPAAAYYIQLTHLGWWWAAPSWLAMAYLAHMFVTKVDGD